MDKHIKKFIPRFEDQSQNISIIDINDLISKDAVMSLKHAGAFTGHSVVLGTEHETSWLLKINDDVKPANTHIHDELDSTEAAASEYGRKIGLADMISFSIDGKVIWNDDTESRCVAVKFFSDDYLTAVDVHRLGEKILRDNITKFVQNNKMLKMSTFLYIIGDIDCNGNNILCNMNDIKFIDFGLSFADDNWTPVPHDVPYFMRLLKEDAWKAIPVEYEYQKDFKFWVTFLKEDDLIDVCHKYDIDCEGALHRLHIIKDLITSNNVMADSWDLWHSGLGASNNLIKAPHVLDTLSNVNGDSTVQRMGHISTQTLPNGTIVHHHKTDEGTVFSITDSDHKNGNKIAHLMVEHSDVPDRSPKVSAVHVDPEYRNYGHGKSLYDTAIHHYKKLDSDMVLSPGSNKMWETQIANDPRYDVSIGAPKTAQQHSASLKTNKADELDKGMNGDWQKEGYNLSHTYDHNLDQHRVTAHSPAGQVAGSFIFEKGPKGYMATSSQVQEPHRRKGLATGAYSMIESKIKSPLVPHENRGEDKQSPDAKALWANPNKTFGKAEELNKAPISYEEGEDAQSWQEYPRSEKRAQLHQTMIHPNKHHDRVAMIKGLAQGTKKKKIDGVWHLKLYRGVSEGEHPDDYKQEAKSFTSNKDVAQNFANQYGGDAVEQWIPVKHISYSFNHAHLADGPQHEENAHEHEVIVGPKHE